MQSVLVDLAEVSSCAGGMRSVRIHLGNASPEITPDEVLVPLQLGLYDNEGKVGFRIHVTRHVLDFLDLALDPVIDAFEKASGRPTR